MLHVLHLSLDDGVGGSGRSAYRIHEGLRRRGVASRMLVGTRVTHDRDVRPAARGPLRAADRAFRLVWDRLGWKELYYPSTHLLPYHRWVRHADVVQLYALHSGWFATSGLPRLGRRKPLVWRMSDMWALTGHCAFSLECERWRTGCGACPHLDAYPGLRRDRTAPLWRRKRRLYERTPLTIVAPSRWMERLVRESPLLGAFPVHHIPNGLDTDVFRPRPRREARQLLGLPREGLLLLFSAHALGEFRKGGDVLRTALDQLRSDAPPGLAIALAGGGGERWVGDLPFPVHLMGQIADDARLALAYAAADVFVLPTRADNLPNGVIESMACGTPPVSFDVGGVGEAVRHLETGYLARVGDPQDLALGLRRLLHDPPLRERLGQRAREVAEAEYGLGLQAERFHRLYATLTPQAA